ncbi:G-protein coupled receptor Mth2-like [Athalia rosae]|uniref:G-protein coupled receptor Mth2-like n=1 Tax=Athalia rosae TaxID=37344 RepID=UPI002033C8BD|nr:G-protein coupled receptor Mth2-like [Athalia rosae]
MVAPEGLVVLIHVYTLLSSKLMVDNSDGKCPVGAAVNITGTTGENGSDQRHDTVWSENGSTFECPCDFKTCLPLCCPFGFAGHGQYCVKDNTTALMSSPEDSMGLSEQGVDKVHPFLHDPCESNAADHIAVQLFNVSKNGSIYLPLWDQQVGPGISCLFRESGAPTYSAKVCVTIYPVVWKLVCFNIAFLFALATFIVYSIVPELRNARGLIFRHYLAAFFGCMIAPQIGVRFVLRLSAVWSIVYGTVAIYSCLTCAFWMNVMSFDIWWTFRGFKPVQANTKEDDRKKMRWYMVYAWIGPAVLAAMFCIVASLADLHGETERVVTLWFIFGPIAVIATINSILYITTAISIKNRKKDTKQFQDGVNKHHRENEQWFNLYLKLFIIMGSQMILLATSIIANSHKLASFSVVLQVIQCICIFIIFVWKDDVKRSLHKRFVAIFDKLRLCLRCGPAATT